MFTEYVIIEANEEGDINVLDACDRLPEALREFNQLQPRLGHLLSIEGRRELDNGVRKYRRIGVTKNGGVPEIVRKTWATADGGWYESGDEPDFGDRT